MSEHEIERTLDRMLEFLEINPLLPAGLPEYDQGGQPGAAFHHDSQIPVPFALAVYRIMHNQATADDWELIDSHRETALDWIKSILKSNEVANFNKEVAWWKQELGYE